jgi:uncharacterized circularly permuted ATP-grasp superfamily protein
MVFAKKAEPLSYADGPRLDRAIKTLSADARLRFVTSFNEHLKSPIIQSVQRCGATLQMVVGTGGKQTVQTFDFSAVARAQCCLTALTDCLRSQGAPVQVLMPKA